MVQKLSVPNQGMLAIVEYIKSYLSSWRDFAKSRCGVKKYIQHHRLKTLTMYNCSFDVPHFQRQQTVWWSWASFFNVPSYPRKDSELKKRKTDPALSFRLECVNVLSSSYIDKCQLYEYNLITILILIKVGLWIGDKTETTLLIFYYEKFQAHT